MKIPPLKIPAHKGFSVQGTVTGRLSSRGCPPEPSAVDRLAAKVDPEIAERVRRQDADIAQWKATSPIVHRMADEMTQEIDDEILSDLLKSLDA